MADLINPPSPPRLFAALMCQDGTPHLPFDFQIKGVSQFASQSSANAGGVKAEQMAGSIPPQKAAKGVSPKDSQNNQSQAPASGVFNCTGTTGTTPCSVSRTFTSEDKEYWDFSGAVAIPGVRQTTYTFSTTTNKTTASVTTHTDAYVFADIFPFGDIANRESAFPHFIAGVPVTSQSLYRPVFGVAENLTGWTHLQKSLSLPVALNFFVGACYMKTELISGPLPTTQAEYNSALIWHRVWKPVYGIEIPISSIASKIGGKGKSK